MDWSAAGGGIQRLRAWFAGAAYGRHRHDTYAVGITDAGVQTFWYRGTVHRSVPGDVIVLHPDEVHDGYAGTSQGFGYRILYVEPHLVAEAMRCIAAWGPALPFLREPVVQSRALRAVVESAFSNDAGSLATEDLALALAEGLCAEASIATAAVRNVDVAAVKRARDVLEARPQRMVHSSELESASGLSRFDLARQFRAYLGTSPYRYSVMRRLEWARTQLGSRAIADVAADAGFADQAHFTRAFRGGFGMTPGRYAGLVKRGVVPASLEARVPAS